MNYSKKLLCAAILVSGLFPAQECRGRRDLEEIVLPAVAVIWGATIVYKSYIAYKNLVIINGPKTANEPATPIAKQLAIESFDEVIAGQIPAKINDIIEFLRAPEKFQKMGATMPRGYLFYGPPGTGKTAIARAIAAMAGCPFVAVSGSEFVDGLVGRGASKIRELFANARNQMKVGNHKTAIIFIDEIDAIGCKRAGGTDSGTREYQQTLNQLLTEMDGFSQDESIIVIGATNRIEDLDPALLRPGRLSRKIILTLPNAESRKSILEFYAKGLRLDPVINFSVVAEKTAGMAGADLKNLMNEAAIEAVHKNSPVITFENIMTALKAVQQVR